MVVEKREREVYNLELEQSERFVTEQATQPIGGTPRDAVGKFEGDVGVGVITEQAISLKYQLVGRKECELSSI